MARALVSHQCGPGSKPGVDTICGLSLLLVLVSASRVFAGFSCFPFSTKNYISKFQFDLETVDEEPLCGYAMANSYLFLFCHFYSFKTMISDFAILGSKGLVWT